MDGSIEPEEPWPLCDPGFHPPIRRIANVLRSKRASKQLTLSGNCHRGNAGLSILFLAATPTPSAGAGSAGWQAIMTGKTTLLTTILCLVGIVTEARAQSGRSIALIPMPPAA